MDLADFFLFVVFLINFPVIKHITFFHKKPVMQIIFNFIFVISLVSNNIEAQPLILKIFD